MMKALPIHTLLCFTLSLFPYAIGLLREDVVDPPGFDVFVERAIQHGMQSPISTMSPTDGDSTRRMTLGEKDVKIPYSTTTSTSPDHRPIRVLFETTTLRRQAEEKGGEWEVKAANVEKYILPKIEKQLFDSLSVERDPGYYIPPQVCFGGFDIPESWSTDGLVGYDMIVMVSTHDAIEVDGITQELCFYDSGFSVLASATACAFNGKDRPIIGFINICLSEIDLEDDDTFSDATIKDNFDVLLHEITHVLGLISSMFPYYRDSTTGEPLTPRPLETTTARCVADGSLQNNLAMPCENTLKYNREEVPTVLGSETRGYYELTLPTVRQVVRNQFNCQSLEGARLENQPTSDDCTGSHFDERYFFTELLSAIYDEDADYFSPLTLALLEDTGYYKANFAHSNNSPWGLGAGCDFVNEKCIVDNKVPDYGKGYFCDHENNKPWQCGPSHLYRGKCDLDSIAFPDIQYFDTVGLGPRSFIHADYCPLVVKKTLDCDKEDAGALWPAEQFGDDSKCMDVSVDGEQAALCISSSCNEETHTFDFTVEGKTYSCTKDFEIIDIRGSSNEYSFQCPRIPTVCPDMFCPHMCSGKGVCNWSLPQPACECFDSSDDTPGCTNSPLNSAGPCEGGVQSSSIRSGVRIQTHMLLILATLSFVILS